MISGPQIAGRHKRGFTPLEMQRNTNNLRKRQRRFLSLTGPVRNHISITKNISNGAGFTLLEVFMAIVLSLAAFWCMDAYARGLLAAKESESLITATNFAHEKMEEIRRKSYTDVVPETRQQVDTAGVGRFFYRQVNVTENSGINSSYKTVDVIVYWQLPRGGEQSLTLSTYVADF